MVSITSCRLLKNDVSPTRTFRASSPLNDLQNELKYRYIARRYVFSLSICTYTSNRLSFNVSFLVTPPLDGSLSTSSTRYATSASLELGKGTDRSLGVIKAHRCKRIIVQDTILCHYEGILRGKRIHLQVAHDSILRGHSTTTIIDPNCNCCC